MIEFYPWQIEAYENIKGKNALLSSPTGSGKSIVAYLWSGILGLDGKTKRPHRKTIFTAPIKALSNERYLDLKNLGLDVGLETGDFKKNSEADIICCTQEIYSMKYSHQNNISLIIDEFHYIFRESERSRVYIQGILDTPKDSDILIMSATFGKTEKIVRYLSNISGKKFYPHTNETRATDLVYLKDGMPVREIKDSLVFAFSKKNIEGIIERLIDSRVNFKLNEKTEDRIDQIANILEVYNPPICVSKGLGTYYGQMLPKEKLFIENCFRERLIDTVVGTDALSLGVNLPAEYVIFAQLAKLVDGPLTKNEFLQISGRAGRRGFFDIGYVSYLGLKNNPFETKPYVTKFLYRDILSAKQEDARIDLTLDIKGLLSGSRSRNDEADFISEYSLPKIDRNDILRGISKRLNSLNAVMHRTLKQKSAVTKVKKIMEKTWDAGLPDKLNIKLALVFLNNQKPDIMDIVGIFAQNESNDLMGMLRARCFYGTLDDSLYMTGLEKLDEEIMNIDSSIFTFEDKLNKIKETRGH